MDSICERSFLMIAATDAPDGDAGLFFHRDPVQIGPCSVSVHWPVEDTADENNTPCAETHLLFQSPPNVEIAYFIPESLTRRGWALQERTLSPHVIHWVSMQVLWTYKLRESETYTEGIDVPHTLCRRLTNSAAFDWSGVDAELSTLEEEHPSEFCWNAVQNYTECRLTRPGDKLVAIGGIAARLADTVACYHGRYWAGL